MICTSVIKTENIFAHESSAIKKKLLNKMLAQRSMRVCALLGAVQTYPYQSAPLLPLTAVSLGDPAVEVQEVKARQRHMRNNTTVLNFFYATHCKEHEALHKCYGTALLFCSPACLAFAAHLAAISLFLFATSLLLSVV